MGRHHEGVHVHEAATADDSPVAGGGAVGEVLEGHLVSLVSVPVQAPFPHVAAHVEEAPGIWLTGADWAGAGGLLGVPLRPAKSVTVFEREMESTGRACSTGVFPFRLGRQTIRLAISLAQPVAKLDSISICDQSDWQAVGDWVARVRPLQNRILFAPT